jgi:TRAP-type C4-dicarboxylate transport system permease small subunit
MTVIIGINVFMRYVLDSGLAWAEEVALVLLVWFTFISFALGVKKKLHISINIMPENLAPVIHTILEKIQNILVAGTGVVMIVYGRILVQFTMRSVMPSLGVPSGYLYMILPVCGVLIIYDSVFELFGIPKNDASLEKYFHSEEDENA